MALLCIGCGGVNKIDDETNDGGTVDAADFDSGADAPLDALIASHTVFVSSTTFPADLGGRDQYSQQCQILASNAGLGGTFVALLHLRSNPLDVDDILIDGPVVNAAGDLVALDADEFFSGTLRAGNGATESGGVPADTVAWVGTPEGANLATCGDWGTTADNGGQVNVTTTTWLTASSTAPCTLSRSIQCISQ